MVTAQPAALYQVDAFTDRPFHGNPAGVCLVAGEPSVAWMQALAAEMNCSETAFLWPLADEGETTYRVRYFTPTVEVPLCGHATLSSSHVLYKSGRVSCDQRLVLQANEDRLEATAEGDRVCMRFPAYDAMPVEPPEGLLEALGRPVPHGVYATANHLHLVEYPSEEDVRALVPDSVALLDDRYWGVIATARSSDWEYDFCSRFFAPQVGVNEDPVTGVAHCCLGPFWWKRLAHGSEMIGHQVSAREGVVGMRLAPDGETIELLGQAVTVFRIAMSDGAVEAH